LLQVLTINQSSLWIPKVDIFVISPFSLSLEVGVGSGRFAQALGVSYGLDPSMELLKLARQRREGGFFCVSAKKIN